MCVVNKEKFFFFDENINIEINSLEHAYLCILNNNLDIAYSIFNMNDSPRAFWGKSLIEILKNYLEHYPTYFQVRNFLEIDLDFLIKNEKFAFVESLLGSLDILLGINQEVYKFAARVMLHNKLYKIAYNYMVKSKEFYYNDPELHFMFASYYYNSLNFEAANYSINECLKLISNYYPAIELKSKIEEKIV